VDRIYKGVGLNGSPLTLVCGEKRELPPLELKADGFTDAVVWNPWIEKASRMGDYGDAEYKEHFCYEVAACDSIKLEPGMSWTATQTIKANSV